MTVLGIETSTELCGVCILNDAGVLAERSIVEARVHSEKLLSLVREVFLEAQVEMHDIAAVSVSIGPGSFTGLRIGLSSAKGLCYALDKPMVVVSTFDAVAEMAVRSGVAVKNFAIALDAKQGEHYVGAYSVDDGRVKPTSKLEVLTTAHAAERMRLSAAGYVVSDTLEVWRSELGKSIEVGSLLDFCRAESVARLGLERVRTNEFADVASAEPMYLKDFVAKSAR